MNFEGFLILIGACYFVVPSIYWTLHDKPNREAWKWCWIWTVCCVVYIFVEGGLVWYAVYIDPNKEIYQPKLDDHVYNNIKEWWWIPEMNYMPMFIILAISGMRQGKNRLPVYAADVGKLWVTARMLRTVTFLLVTLPNPMPGCYVNRFKADFESHGFWYLFFKLKDKGGCNDLLYSGHCIATAIPTNFTLFGLRQKRIGIAMVLFSFVDGLYRVQTLKHYSVDVWLSWLTCTLLYHALNLKHKQYYENKKLKSDPESNPVDNRDWLEKLLRVPINH